MPAGYDFGRSNGKAQPCAKLMIVLRILRLIHELQARTFLSTPHIIDNSKRSQFARSEIAHTQWASEVAREYAAKIKIVVDC